MAGYDGIIIEGNAEKPVYIWIFDQNVEIRNASHLWGKDTFVTNDLIQKETHPKASVVCIGQAGENLVKFASIVSDGKHSRVAARCGLGAIAGSKMLKAVSVKGSGPINIFDKSGLNGFVKNKLMRYKENSKSMSITGTPWLVVNQEKLGSYPIKNWSKSRWEAGARKTGWEAMEKMIFSKKYHCANCIIGCGRTVHVKNGKYASIEQGGPEYIKH